MTLDRQGNLAGTTGARARMFYQADDASWHEVPGIGSMTINPDSSDSATYAAMEGSFSTTGADTIGTVDFEVTSFLPNHPAWEFLDMKRRAKQNVSLRAETQLQTVFTPSGDVAITANTGVLDFDTAGDALAAVNGGVARGHEIGIGADLTALGDGNLHTIESISDAATPVFTSATKMAVSSTKARFFVPIYRFVISGAIQTGGGASLAQDAAMGSQLTIQPASSVARPTKHLKHTGET